MVSDRGASTATLKSLLPYSPIVRRAFAPNSPVGLFERTTMAPAVVFLPNKVPCGPLKTSTCSTSNKSRLLLLDLGT